MKLVTFGIIGAGRIGKLHAENLTRCVSGARLKTIIDPFLDENWASSLNIPVTGKNPQIILEDPEINAILISSPSVEHAAQMIECAKAGKHIFCEKPIALEPEKIKNALAEVEKSKVKLQVGFNRRFDPNFSAVRNQVTSGDLGEPHVIRITSRDPIPPSKEYIANSGGMFLDMTIHDFDMARFLSGSEVSEVHAYGAVLVDQRIGIAGDIDTAIISLKFTNGALGIIENSRKAIYGYDQRVEVFGSKGCAVVDNALPTSMAVYNKYGIIKDKPPYFFLERYEKAFINELQMFVNSIREDKNPTVSGKDGLNAVLIAIAAIKSLKRGSSERVEFL